jgi:hypothetical protein
VKAKQREDWKERIEKEGIREEKQMQTDVFGKKLHS